FDEPLDRFLAGSGRMGTVVAHVYIGSRIAQPLGPTRAENNPVALGDAAMLGLPGLKKLGSKDPVFVLADFFGCIDDNGRCNEVAWIDGIHRVLWQVLARNPVRRRIEVGTSVFATGKVVPVPGGARI